MNDQCKIDVVPITNAQYIRMRDDIMSYVRSLGVTRIVEIGSTGRRSIMGDIDLAIDVSMTRRDEIIETIVENVDRSNVRKVGVNIVSFPYEFDGGHVQVDLMLCDNVDYVAWARAGSSDIDGHVDRSRVMGCYRNMLFDVILRTSAQFDVRDGEVVMRCMIFDRDRGLQQATRRRTRSSRKQWKTVEQELISTDPKFICHTMFGDGVDVDRTNTFENVVRHVMASSATRDRAYTILGQFVDHVRGLPTYDRRFTLLEVNDVVDITLEMMRGR